MGMVAPSVAKLTVEHDDGTSFQVQIFRVSDDSLPEASYYLALLPTDTAGQLVARDDTDEVVAQVKIRRWMSSPICPTFHPSPSP